MNTETRELICIGCPMGCRLTVTMEDGTFANVTGNTCPRGAEYSKKEVTDPRRIVTSSVSVTGGKARKVPVKTRTDIPKGKIFDVMEEIKNITVKAPVAIGNVICHNIAGTGVELVATKNII